MDWQDTYAQEQQIAEQLRSQQLVDQQLANQQQAALDNQRWLEQQQQQQGQPAPQQPGFDPQQAVSQQPQPGFDQAALDNQRWLDEQTASAQAAVAQQNAQFDVNQQQAALDNQRWLEQQGNAQPGFEHQPVDPYRPEQVAAERDAWLRQQADLIAANTRESPSTPAFEPPRPDEQPRPVLESLVQGALQGIGEGFGQPPRQPDERVWQPPPMPEQPSVPDHFRSGPSPVDRLIDDVDTYEMLRREREEIARQVASIEQQRSAVPFESWVPADERIAESQMASLRDRNADIERRMATIAQDPTGATARRDDVIPTVNLTDHRAYLLERDTWLDSESQRAARELDQVRADQAAIAAQLEASRAGDAWEPQHEDALLATQSTLAARADELARVHDMYDSERVMLGQELVALDNRMAEDGYVPLPPVDSAPPPRLPDIPTADLTDHRASLTDLHDSLAAQATAAQTDLERTRTRQAELTAELEQLRAQGEWDPHTEGALMTEQSLLDDQARDSQQAYERLRNEQAELGQEIVIVDNRIEETSYVPEPTLVPWGAKVSEEFKAKAADIAKDIEIPLDHLMACMAFESGRTFSPSVKHPKSTATGLIQFIEPTARELGTSTEQLAKLTAEEQLDWVHKYFEPFRGKLNDIEDVYMAILSPAAVGKPPDHPVYTKGTRAYELNAPLDADGDGVISKREAGQKVRELLAEGYRHPNRG